MSNAYVGLEFKRLFRNQQSFIFSIVIPIVVFLAIATSKLNDKISGDVTWGRFYLAGMIGVGTITTVFSGGLRIAIERQIGWNRSLRLTPLPAWKYLASKILTSYVLAIVTIVLLTLVAVAIGVHIDVGDWLTGFGLIMVALVPFAALGVMVGHLVRGDAMGPVTGLGTSLFAILGGAYFPIGGSGVMHTVVRLVPSFWLVQGGKTGIGGQAWTAEAWIVIVVWTAFLSALAMWAYRRDTERVA